MAVLCLAVTTKEIVMDENEFEFNGKVFVSMPNDGYCGGCYFDSGLHCMADNEVPSCSRERRNDKKFVIFVEKQQ